MNSQKRLLLTLKYLWEKTDEEHPVTWIILKKEDRKSKRSVGQIGRQAIIMRMRAERVIKAVDILKNGKF